MKALSSTGVGPSLGVTRSAQAHARDPLKPLRTSTPKTITRGELPPSRTRFRRRSRGLLFAVGPTILLSAMSAGLVVGCGGDSAGARDAQNAVQALKAAHPGAKIQVEGNRVRLVYGVVATGNSPHAAAEGFRQRHAAAFGVEPGDLAPEVGKGSEGREGASSESGVGLMYNPTTGKYKFRLYSYRQQRDGITVFGSGMRTLVREDDGNAVVWANADLRPLGNFKASATAPTSAVNLEKSLQALRNNPELTHQLPAPTALAKVSSPTSTIFAGVGAKEAEPRMAIQYTAQDANGIGRWTFVADAATGDVLHVQSHLHFAVNGTVKAQVITGPESLECGTLGIVPLPYANVTSSAGNAITDAAGAFSIPQSGSAAVSLTSTVTGKFFKVVDEESAYSLSLKVTPPGPADFVHRDTQVPPESVLARLNAYKHANDLRDMLLKYVPDYPVIAEQTDFQINVNLADQNCGLHGGAYYNDDITPRTLNFCRSTADRPNMAFRSIIHHEYGHHIIDSGKSWQDEYGEGMADTIAMLFSKDPRIGIGAHLKNCDEPLRNAATNCQYIEGAACSSCGDTTYGCGGLISGIVWDIWKQLDASEPERSDDIIRSLVFSSIPMHRGSKIQPSLAVDLLTLDDDDKLIENGTPHYQEICAGFEQHGIKCPAILDGLVLKGTDLAAEGPSNGPFQPSSMRYTLHNLGPEPNMVYSVKIPSDARWLTVDSMSGTIALGQPKTVAVSIDQAQAALLPNGKYTANLEFVNQTSGVGNVSRAVKLRVGAPVPIYTATFTNGDMSGFTIDSVEGNLWHGSVRCKDGLPGHTSDGSLFYGKDENCVYNTPVPYQHTVVSPAIKIANPREVELGFNYYLATEQTSDRDMADVALSVDGGPFQTIASNKNGGGQPLAEGSNWSSIRMDLSELLPANGPTTIQLRFSFNAVTPYNNNKDGFVVDDVVVYGKPQSCTSNTQCDDGVSCNGVETCVNQVCAPGTPVTCDDGNACTKDWCDSAAGCKHENNTDPCADDGNACTNDVCGGGICTHPDNGSCAAQGPCAGYCMNPIQFSTSNYQSGDLGTNATCHETMAPLRGGLCGNFASSRQLFVNGVPMTCNWSSWNSLPSAKNGGHCIYTTSGDSSWASFSTW